MSSNQGRDLGPVLDAVSFDHLDDLARVLWREVHQHRDGATCCCPVMEILARMAEMGYRIAPPKAGDPPSA